MTNKIVPFYKLTKKWITKFFLDSLMDNPEQWAAAKERKQKIQAVIKEMEDYIKGDLK